MPDTHTLTENCVHHWVLAHPEDDVIHGRCKRCNATREYPASVEDAAKPDPYEDASKINRTIALLPDGGSDRLPGKDTPW